MFENLRDAFREAIENFNRELNRDQVPESVDRLLVGMRSEVVDAKARISELETQIERSRAEVDTERKAADTALRRERMARDIEDGETAEIAARFAAKHTERRGLLEQKVTALEGELAFLRREYEEMMAKLDEAKTKRDALAAAAGRSQARSSFQEAEDLFSELDRMASQIGDEEARGEAAQAFSESEFHVDLDAPPPPKPEIDYDAALEELKRRMGRE